MPVIDLGSPKAQALFAYLVLNHDQALDRRRLAFQLWERSSETAARRNLRQYLHRLRRSLSVVDPDETWFIMDGNRVQFAPPGGFWLDVDVFESAVSTPNEDLITAISLYKGELLENIYEDWLEPERRRLARLYKECLLRQSERMVNIQNWDEAIHYAQLLVKASPLTEANHIRLFRLHHQNQDRAQLIQQYSQLEQLLDEELGIPPATETTQIYRQLLSGEQQTPLQADPVEEPISVSSAPFIGRQNLLSTLTKSYQEAVNSTGNMILIHGEMGIGKTRLVHEWHNQLLGEYTWLVARAHEFEGMIPFSAIREALTINQLGDNIWESLRPAPPWLHALKPILPQLNEKITLENEQEDGNPAHIIQALGSFLFTLARHKLVILYIDNLHWADAQTWNALIYIAQRLQNKRMLIIGTIRTEDMTPDATRIARKLNNNRLAESIALNRLNEEETATLLNEMMPDTVPDPRFIRRLYEETKGNPFFIVETVQAVQETGGDWTEQVPVDELGNRPTFAIPLNVQSVIESRLDRLSDDSRSALAIAATIGREFTFDLLKDVSGVDTNLLLDWLDEWLARGLVQESNDRYDFAHEQLGRVAYQKLSRARRQHVHLQVAESLAKLDHIDPAQLAHHYYESSEPEKALPYLTLSGQRALRVRSYEEAREFGLRAMALSGKSAISKDKKERIDLNLQVAQAYAFTGKTRKAIDLLQETERLAEQVGDIGRLNQILYQSSQMFWLRGEPTRANTYARRILRHAEELDDSDMRSAAIRMLGRTNIALSEFDDAISHLLRYIDLNHKEVVTSDLPVIYGYIGVAYARVGSWQRAIDAAQRGVTLASAMDRGATHVVACMQQAFIYNELNEWETALESLAPVRDVWQEAGMSPHAFMMRVVLGQCLAESGDVKGGEEEIRSAIGWAKSVDHRVLNYMGELGLARVLVLAKDKRAIEVAEKAADMASFVNDKWALAVARHTQAVSEMQRLQKADWVQLEKWLLEAMRTFRQIRARPDLANTYLTMRRLYDRAGKASWAVDCHFRATVIFEELGMEAKLSEARGMAGKNKTGAVVIPGLKLMGPDMVEKGRY